MAGSYILCPPGPPNETSIYNLVSSPLVLFGPCLLYSLCPSRFTGLACTFNTEHQELQ